MSGDFVEIIGAIIGIALMFAPWLLAGQMSLSLGRLRGWAYGSVFFAVVASVLGAVYFHAFTTDRALAASFGVVYAYGILCIAYMVRCRLGKRAGG